MTKLEPKKSANAPAKAKALKPAQKRKYISKKIKDLVLKRQSFACANFPGSNRILIAAFDDTGNSMYYDCPLWKSGPGKFDAAKYQIDHICEVSSAVSTMDIDYVNRADNLQALCQSCHSIKTSTYKRLRKMITGDDIIRGAAPMCVD